jgi:hypothetical protein
LRSKQSAYRIGGFEVGLVFDEKLYHSFIALAASFEQWRVPTLPFSGSIQMNASNKEPQALTHIVSLNLKVGPCVHQYLSNIKLVVRQCPL